MTGLASLSAAGEDPRLYMEWIRREAKAINSDGCSHVLEIHKDCCYEHDLGYYYGRDPRQAYKLDDWSLAARISRKEVDARFEACNGPLMGWYRWLGVRIGGWNIWRKHRKLRP